ncbi:multidrug efflux SMR transporter [Streptomyces sp. UNOB3_S3]|uniref:DMT family transporter n=1 Tax=Streptomyces sp. UNOB3_S3 TaxID=2871682 RepID=UPI001E5D8DC3|nr:multidrug efflux SMR transporter [Streptomyces sp. UNOB3_S3]MCC3775378.1 multidrug efflux SMR transporter [Streptomyces sp. UNOB3_S3]
MGEQRTESAKAWTLLLIAAVFEVVFALSSAANEGFTRLVPSLITVVAGGGGVYLLSLALRTLDVGIGYTVWTGIGSVGAVVFGALLFGEDITVGKVVCLVAIIGGVLGLHMTESTPEADDGTDDEADRPETVVPDVVPERTAKQ